MTVQIDRFDPESGKEWTDSFDVSAVDQRQMTIMDVLEYISVHMDPTLAYYHHSVCNHGICGRCALSVNGKTKLACLTVANDYDELHLAPAKGRSVVRDLVVKP